MLPWKKLLSEFRVSNFAYEISSTINSSVKLRRIVCQNFSISFTEITILHYLKNYLKINAFVTIT